MNKPVKLTREIASFINDKGNEVEFVRLWLHFENGQKIAVKASKKTDVGRLEDLAVSEATAK